MKKIVTLLAFALSASIAFAQTTPFNWQINQRNSANTAYLSKLISTAPGGVDCMAGMTSTGTGAIPSCFGVGTGLQVSGGLLNVTLPSGPQGPIGPQGPQGSAGTNGTNGADGAPGADGQSAYQLAVQMGFPGSPGGWIASLQGVQGDPGQDGAPGVNGLDGATGATGAKGDKGDTGEPGAVGAPAPTFNFSQPAVRTLAVSTSYQATDTAKAAILYPSYACQNATQVLASSACTVQVRVGTSALTCSTGTVYYTQSLTVSLGVLITQNSTNPVPIMLPIGGHFIICPTAGTFTISATEQSAG